ncbi:MAG: hypothetical protein U1B80_04960, partial [Anaerolineaceae bacterium]|nr:hypothetical protein [Anaerolineaceae bacterium]
MPKLSDASKYSLRAVPYLPTNSYDPASDRNGYRRAFCHPDIHRDQGAYSNSNPNPHVYGYPDTNPYVNP